MGSTETPEGSTPAPFLLGTIFGRSKSREAFESQCSAEKIVQFFKCSRKLCDFTCDDKENFYCHLLTHNEDDEQDVCVYCERMFVIENLALHMEAQHGNRRFQCTKCFYRGCTRAHLIVHSLKQHNSKLVTGVACPRMPGASVLDVRARARTLLYRCSLCPYRSFCRAEFESHLSERHHRTTLPRDEISEDLSTEANRLHCVYCRITTDQGGSESRELTGPELIEHLDEEHGLGHRLTCLYCGDILKDEEDALDHMTELHSDWPINVLDRGVRTGSDRSSKKVCLQEAPLPPAERTNVPPKKYTPAPRSVLERRRQKLNQNLNNDSNSSQKNSDSQGSERATPKSRANSKKKVAPSGGSSPKKTRDPPVPSSLFCALCRLDNGPYQSPESLALHMRDKHNVYYICQRCFHGEEKFRLIQSHINGCEGATETDIVTLRNGVLRTSSKVRAAHKDKHHTGQSSGTFKSAPMETHSTMDSFVGRAPSQEASALSVDEHLASLSSAGNPNESFHSVHNPSSVNRIAEGDNVCWNFYGRPAELMEGADVRYEQSRGDLGNIDHLTRGYPQMEHFSTEETAK